MRGFIAHRYNNHNNVNMPLCHFTIFSLHFPFTVVKTHSTTNFLRGFDLKIPNINTKPTKFSNSAPTIKYIKQLSKIHDHGAQQPKESQIDCEKITKVGVYLNLGLFIGKLGVGIYSNSSAMIADAIHYFSKHFSFRLCDFLGCAPTHKPSTKNSLTGTSFKSMNNIHIRCI